MSAYEASVALHVAAAVAGFGVTFAYPLVILAGERAGQRALAVEIVLRLSDRVAVPGAVVVGVTGLYQVLRGPYDWPADRWLAIGTGLYVAIFAVAVGVLRPVLARARDAADEQEYAAAMHIARPVGAAVAAAVLTTVVLMEVKP